MKTIKLFMISFALSFTFFGCEKSVDENEEMLLQKSALTYATREQSEGMCITWVDNFDSPYSMNGNWILYGNPQPEWKAEAYGRNGLFDNNGPSPTKNYAVSEANICRGYGYVIESEVLLKILNPDGTCVCPGIALTKPSNPKLINSELLTGISMRIIYAGSNATWFPVKLRNHTWFLMEFITESGNKISSGYVPADSYSNKWYILKFEVTPEGYVKFFCDDTLLWAPFNRIHPMMESENLIVLGYTSDGNPQTRSGVAYHNWVKATYSYSPEK